MPREAGAAVAAAEQARGCEASQLLQGNFSRFPPWANFPGIQGVTDVNAYCFSELQGTI